MIRLGDRILLMFRGGEEGQIGSARARIKVFESRDRGRTFTLLSEVNANNLPGGRDIRDPKLVEMGGRLFLYAISRVPGFHYRDLGGQAWTIRAESTDGGRTWTAPVRTYQDVDATGVETFWGFWRYTKRTYTEAGKRRQTLFATGYQDFDIAVGLFASDDGITWEKRVDDHRVVQRRAERGRAAVLRQEPRHRGGAGPPRQSGHPRRRADRDLHVARPVRHLGMRPPHRAAPGRPDLDRPPRPRHACAASCSPASTCRARSSARPSTSCAATWPIPARRSRCARSRS